MKIISIRQPWAHLIVHGSKDIENRSQRTHYRGPVLIHASRTPDKEACKDYELDPDELPKGGVVGIAEIVDCVEDHTSEWFDGPFGYVLRKPRPLRFVEWKGALGLRDAPRELTRKLDASVLSRY